jgi:hypothetical protein
MEWSGKDRGAEQNTLTVDNNRSTKKQKTDSVAETVEVDRWGHRLKGLPPNLPLPTPRNHVHMW